MNNNQKELLDVKVMKIDIVATKTAIQQKVEDLEKIILKVAEKLEVDLTTVILISQARQLHET